MNADRLSAVVVRRRSGDAVLRWRADAMDRLLALVVGAVALVLVPTSPQPKHLGSLATG